MDDVRASDAERDVAVEQLRVAAAEGRLTFEELADRIEAASNAVTRGELVPLTADLPVASPTRSNYSPVIRTFGDIKRKGAWVVPAESHFRSFFGAVILDLREATITTREVHIDAHTPFGNIVLLVPEGVDVEVRANALIGKLKQEQTAAAHGAPRIVLTGGTWFGDVKILHRRMWEKFLRRR
jgi:hypothetical protein